MRPLALMKLAHLLNVHPVLAIQRRTHWGYAYVWVLGRCLHVRWLRERDPTWAA